MDSENNKKPFKIKDVTRNIKKAIVASTLEEIKMKVTEKFEKLDDVMPTIHLDSDGTEVDDEEYFRTLEPNTELIAVFPGEHWIDPTQYVTISSHHQRRSSSIQDTTDATITAATAAAAAAAESDRIKKLVGQIKNNLCNVSVMNDTDLDSLSDMDPNSLVDITGKEYMMDQLTKDTTGRSMCAKREAEDRINLLKLLIDEAILSKSSVSISEQSSTSSIQQNTMKIIEKIEEKQNQNEKQSSNTSTSTTNNDEDI